MRPVSPDGWERLTRALELDPHLRCIGPLAFLCHPLSPSLCISLPPSPISIYTWVCVCTLL